MAQLFAIGVRGTAPSPGLMRVVAARLDVVVLTDANWSSPTAMRRLTARIAANARSARHVAPLFGAGPGLSQTGIKRGMRVKAARRHAAADGRWLHAAGLDLTLGPVADVGAEGSPLAGATFGNDPQAVGNLLSAALSGYKRSNTIAAVGHFPGQGSAAGDPNTGPASVGQSLTALRARDLRPFAAVTRSAPVVVASNAIYAAFDGATPAVLLPETMRMLRGRLGYRGVVMSDDLLATSATAQTDIGKTAVAARGRRRSALRSAAPRQQEQAYKAVLDAYRRGTISSARLRASVRRVLALKLAYRVLR